VVLTKKWYRVAILVIRCPVPLKLRRYQSRFMRCCAIA
jgi:hypothetical protein